MRKISALLSEMPASLSRKAADTEQTLQSILQDLFNKNTGGWVPIRDIKEIENDEAGIQVANELTNTMKN